MVELQWFHKADFTVGLSLSRLNGPGNGLN